MRKVSHFHYVLAPFFVALLWWIPPVVHAQNAGFFTTILGQALTLLDTLLALVVAIALLLFFWGLALFIFKADDEAERAKGRQIMIWGLIALFVIISVWGLVAILRSVFGASDNTDFAAPARPANPAP